jgi:hypothetical protein
MHPNINPVLHVTAPFNSRYERSLLKSCSDDHNLIDSETFDDLFKATKLKLVLRYSERLDNFCVRVHLESAVVMSIRAGPAS